MPRLSLWKNTRFLLIWSGQTLSIFGDRVTGLALPWLLLQQTHSAFDSGLITAVRYLPLISLGLVAGLIADRINRRILMILCDIGRALALGSVAVLGVIHLLPPLWLLAGVVLMLGVGQLGFQVAYSAWLPDVTGEQTLSQVNAALEASDALSTLTGASLGGALIQIVGATLALGADAMSYVVSALTLLAIRDKGALRATSSKETDQSLQRLWQAMWQGWRYVLTTPVQLLLKGVSLPINLTAGAIELLLVMLTQLRLHLPAWQAGLVLGAAGAGGLLGSALAPQLHAYGWRKGLGWAMGIAALACSGLASADLLGTGWGFAIALLANFLLDGAVALCFIITSTENTLVTPRELRGRVNAASTMYASLVRALSVLGVAVLAANNDPLGMFVLLAGGFVVAAALSFASKLPLPGPVN